MSKRTIGLYSTGGVVMIGAFCVLLNLVSSRYYFRVDCTEYRIYSLSPASKKILGELTDPLRIKIYFDEALPPEFSQIRRYLDGFLHEMSTASRGKLRVEFADMKKPETREEARRAGIAPLQFTAIRKDKFEVQEGMMGLAMYYEDKQEAIPAVTEIGNVEYELMGRMVKLIRKKRPVVGWTASSGEMEPPDNLRQYLSQNFDLRRIPALNTAGWGPGQPYSDISAFIVPGPRSALTDTGLRAVDRAVLAGIPTAILLDLYDVHMGNFFVRKNETGLERLLESYGVRAKEGLVADAQNIQVQIQSQQGMFTMQTIVNYPYIPRVTDLSKDHPVTRALQELALPFVTPLEVLDSSGVTVLARSSKESYRIARPFVASPTEQVDVRGADPGPFILGVSIQGRRRSAFADVPAPAGTPKEGDVRLLIIANSNFLDESRGGSVANMNFAANMIDWLSSAEDLITIRSKTNTFRPLEKVSDQKRNLIKAVDLFLMPLIVAFLGAVRWQVRRLRRRQWEDGLSA